MPQAQEDSILTVDVFREIAISQMAKIETIEWSPSGQYLAVGGSNGILLFDENFNLTEALLPDFVDVVSINWSPDGSRLAVVYGLWGEMQIAIVNITTSRYLNIGYSFIVTPVQWSPFGTQLAMGLGDDSVIILDGVTLETISSFQGEDEPSNTNHPTSVCWLSETEFLAVFGLHFYHINSLSGELLEDLPGGTSYSTECYTERGVSVSSSGSIRDLSSGEWSQITAFFFGFDVALSSTGQYAAFNIAEGLVQIWSLDSHSLLAEMQGGMGEEDISIVHYDDSITWRYDDHYLAAVGDDNILRIWQVTEE
jgi:WD40 repeat protein